jgi:phosphoglycerol transferase MdoB-like AlkP superfamily enzyme
LRRFFERASKEPWYQNTIFVLVADHTNQASHDVYKTDLGLYSIPIIFFAPDGSIAPALRDDAIVQQTDITPTLLHLLGYSKPYFAFGDDLLSGDSSQTWAFNYNAGIYQFVKGDLLLQFDGAKATALYHFKTDPLLKQNLVGTLPEQQSMETQLKAIIQQYMSRMNENRLLPDR